MAAPQPAALSSVAALAGVAASELSAAWRREEADPRRDFLLGKLLLSAQAAHLVGAICAVGASGTRLLGTWADEQADLLGAGTSERGLPSCCRAELRRSIQESLGGKLDSGCASRLAKLGYLRLASWNNDDLERSLEDGEELSGVLLDRVVGWFLEGLTMQVVNLVVGLNALLALYRARELEESLPFSRLLLMVLSTADAAFKCLRAAAPLATRAANLEDGGDESFAALLSIRALDWAFRRVEVDRPDVVLRLRWRMGACHMLWGFLSREGQPELVDPDDVARSFVVECVLPALQAPGEAARVDAPGADEVAADAEPGATREEKRRRPRRKPRPEAEAEAEAEEADERPDGAESEAARREWARLSVRMMMEMGWRAETGDVGQV